MKSTREKILEAALDLFNEYGLSKVSQRLIAEKLAISPGNLTYHFKLKEDIEEALYFELVAKIDDKIKEFYGQEMNLQSIVNISGEMFKLFYVYRFIFIE